MSKRIIATERAPRPGGQYSQGVRWDRIAFTAGQVAIDPMTGQPVAGGVREQTRQALRNVRAVVEAAGSDLASVVKTTCFLANIDDFPVFDEVYREFFPADPPARSTFQVGLVAPWLVEVEAIAVLP